MMAETKHPEFKHLVRIVKTDLEGSKAIVHALKKIKGVGDAYANMICGLAGIAKDLKTGHLNVKQVELLEKVIHDPVSAGAPEWMFNRKKNLETGKCGHLILSDLEFAVENDIKRLMKIRCYKGERHKKKLPCRGQRTRSNFRKNKSKTTLGVKKKGK